MLKPCIPMEDTAVSRLAAEFGQLRCVSILRLGCPAGAKISTHKMSSSEKGTPSTS